MSLVQTVPFQGNFSDRHLDFHANTAPELENNLIFKDPRQEVVDASSPDAPVVSAREGRSRNVQRLALQHFIVMLKTCEIVVLRTHGTIEYLKAGIEFFRILKEFQMRLL